MRGKVPLADEGSFASWICFWLAPAAADCMSFLTITSHCCPILRDQGAAQMQKKAKREVRRIRHQSAWITLNGLDASECEIMDISNNGAKIVPDGTRVIPAHFELAFAQGKRHACEVVWRRGRMLGVKFVK
jgi:hypothetical protein